MGVKLRLILHTEGRCLRTGGRGEGEYLDLRRKKWWEAEGPA